MKTKRFRILRKNRKNRGVIWHPWEFIFSPGKYYVKNDEGRFAPVFDDEQTEETACTTVLYCIGQKADWRTLLTGTAVELRPNGTNGSITKRRSCISG